MATLEHGAATLARAQRRNALTLAVILALTAVTWFAAEGAFAAGDGKAAVIGAMVAKLVAIFVVFMGMGASHVVFKVGAGALAATLAVLFAVL